MKNHGPGVVESSGGSTRSGRPGRHRRGFTLLELLVALAVLGILATVSAPSIAAHRDATALRRGASAVRGLLAAARQAAVTRRAVVRVRVDPRGTVTATADDGTEVGALPLGSGDLALDSVRLRPATLRFNPRGQAAPGSAYLHRGDRRVRIVCNFVGRVREEWSGG